MELKHEIEGMRADLVEISDGLLLCVLFCPSRILFNQVSLQPNPTLSKLEREEEEGDKEWKY